MKLDKAGLIFLTIVCLTFGFGSLTGVVFGYHFFDIDSMPVLILCGFIGGFGLVAVYVYTVCEFLPGVGNEPKMP